MQTVVEKAAAAWAGISTNTIHKSSRNLLPLPTSESSLAIGEENPATFKVTLPELPSFWTIFSKWVKTWLSRTHRIGWRQTMMIWALNTWMTMVLSTLWLEAQMIWSGQWRWIRWWWNKWDICNRASNLAQGWFSKVWRMPYLVAVPARNNTPQHQCCTYTEGKCSKQMICSH